MTPRRKNASANAMWAASSCGSFCWGATKRSMSRSILIRRVFSPSLGKGIRRLAPRLVMYRWKCALALVVWGSAATYAQNEAPTFAHAFALHQAGDFDGAIHEYREVLKQDPANFQARSNLGAALV